MLASLVVYTAQAKVEFLDVSWDTINENGTISEETTLALLKGLKKVAADISLAITGVAGRPMDGKPIGTMYIGISSKFGTNVNTVMIPTDPSDPDHRIQVKGDAVIAALRLVLEEVKKFNA